MALKNNTWKLNQWYDQSVAGNATYSGQIELWIWGRNDNGLLGQNAPQNSNYSSPVQMPGSWSTPPINFQSNVGKNVILPKTDGTLWGWGRNDNANLALNDKVKRSSPTQIGSDTDWSKSGCLEEQGWAIKTDGTLWVWGDNNYGQLGQNERTYRSSPVQLPGTDWQQLYGGASGASYAMKTDGTVWCWGRGGGRLGLNQPTNSHYSSPVQIPGDWSVFDAGGPSNAGGIKTDGTMWMWGSNPKGELGQNEHGDGTQRSSPCQIPGTTWQTVSTYNKGWGAVKTDGTLWMIGGNYYGKLGQNNETDYSSPIQIPGTNWDTKISFSYRNQFAAKTDGTFWAWGYNDEGNLGLNNRTSYSSPVQIPGTDWYSMANIGGGGQGAFGVKEL